MQTFSRFVVTIAFAGCSADGFPANTILPNSLSWGLINPLGQQVTAATRCQSGWNELVKQLNEQGKGADVPIQEQWVDRFESVEAKNEEEANAFPHIGYPFMRVRESLVWPCWEEKEEWRAAMRASVARLLADGYFPEITLYQHDSYPARFHDPTPNFGIPKSGWATSDILFGFGDYAQSVAATFEDVLPKLSRVYIVHEPVPMLVKSYLGKGITGGPWPPGGKRADAAFASAMRNLRDAVYDASFIMADEGWEPAIAQNIRLTEEAGPDAERLNYIYSWWLLDALIDGCVDNDFDGACEQSRPPSAIAVVGVTFYGTMAMTDEVVSLAARDAAGVMVRFGEPSWRPDTAAFKAALLAVHARYPAMPVAVAEIGLSEGDLATQGTLLRQYRDVVLELHRAGAVEGSMQLHTMFKSAEFTPGNWQFAIVGNCANPATCELTPWGTIAKEIAEGR